MYAMSLGHQIIGGVEFKIEMSVSGLVINALSCRSKAEIRYLRRGQLLQCKASRQQRSTIGTGSSQIP
jgi:hypothetical protein